jgi:murein DD-endopeptidase MepM/ murein hydrolase activator NlpD
MHLTRIQFVALFAAALMACDGFGQTVIESKDMQTLAQELMGSNSLQYPLDDYFPETPVTSATPPRGELHHAGEDSYAPAGTPVYAVADGIVRYSGRSRGYGWLIIIDHPELNVYSLYGHLSTSSWKKSPGEVKKGELIAYLAEATEGETMVSHIHFGLRMGQMADYPPIGDHRWMAGYTSCLPEQAGWFKASEIIGETEAMKEWHRYIRKREDIGTDRDLHASDFKITAGKYHEKEDLDRIITKEFGEGYRLADWKDILGITTNIEAWADSLGLAAGEENAPMISNEGYRIWLGRQYYLSRFNHQKPPQFLAFGHIDDNFLCLGSWMGIEKPILAVRK